MLQLPESWPESQDPHFTRHGFSNSSAAADNATRNLAVENLILELASVIDSPQEHIWLRDVRFFSVNMLLVLCSTQLYANHTNHSIRSDGSVAGLSFNSDADLFLNYLFSHAEGQLRGALSGGSGQASSSSAFSNCLAVQLVRGLIIGSTGAISTDQSPVVSEPSTVLLTKLVAAWQGQPEGASQSAAASSSNSSAASSSSAVGVLLWDILMYLPLSALNRFFRSAPATLQNSNSNSTAAIVAAEFTDSAELAFHHTRVAGSTAPGSEWSGVAHAGDQHQHSQLLPVPHRVPNSQRLPADPLSERCANLLLVLLHNRRSSSSPHRPNPFREAFGLLHDLSVSSSALSSATAAGYGDEESYSEADLEGGGGLSPQYQQQQQLMQGQEGRTSATSASSVFMINASRIHVSMPQVIRGVVRNLPGESSILLLYSLLQGHPTFMETLIRTNTVGLVLSSCLRGLYSLTSKPEKKVTGSGDKGLPSSLPPSSKNLNQLYILVVCVLMLLQDSSVLQEIVKHEHEVPMDWYKERQLKHASLLDAALLCLLRTVMHALFRLQDQYLLSNACAALHNLSTRMQRAVLPYTAERLVRVLCQLCSRAVKHQENNKNSKEIDARTALEENLLPEALGALLQLTDTALRPEKVSHNVHLLYALMHDSHTVEPLFAHSAVRAALEQQELSGALGQRVLETTQHYLALLEVKVGANNDSPLTAAQTVDWLLSEVASGKKHVHSSTHSDVASITDSRGKSNSSSSGSSGSSKHKYSYQEAESPEEFFLPCIWAAALRSTPEVPWQLLQLTLLDPLATDFIYLDAPHTAGNDSEADGVMDDAGSVANSVDFV
eukprot:gene13339-15366_t